MRTHRHTHTNLTCPLGHTHQHDVHDSDATDHERHACDCTEQKRHHARGGGGGLSDFLLVAHGEIIVASGTNVMPLPKQRDNLLLGRFELLWIGDLHVDIAKSGAANHTLHCARVRHDNNIVLVHALCAQPFGRQDTRDGERDLFDS